jgi:hypothetical protein
MRSDCRGGCCITWLCVVLVVGVAVGVGSGVGVTIGLIGILAQVLQV